MKSEQAKNGDRTVSDWPRKLAYTGLLMVWTVLLTMAETAADVIVSEDRMRREVEAYVRGVLSDFDGDIEVDVRRVGGLRVDGVGAVDLSVRPAGDRSNSRSIPVFLDVVRGPAVVQSIPLSAGVRYFDEVVVAARPIERGESLDGEAVTLERREVTTLLGRYLRDPGALKGTQARVRIGFGRAVDPRYLEKIPVVNRGDQVRIRVALGGIIATAHGLATEAGALGERIVVQNVASREKLLAEVVAPGLVQVTFH